MSKFRLAVVLALVVVYILLVLSYIICLRFEVFHIHRWLLYTDKVLIHLRQLESTCL